MDPDVKKLSDAMTVMEAFQRSHDKAMDDHREWLINQDQAINRINATLEQLAAGQLKLQATLQAYLDSLKGHNGNS